MTVSNAARIGCGCPYCANRKVLPGFNDLATTNPDVAADLVDPSDALRVTRGSRKRLKWRCRLDAAHVFEMPVGDKVMGRGCPICGMSTPQQELTEVVRKLVAPDKVLSNDHSILSAESLELDVVVPARHVAIEMDGVWWHCEANTERDACSIKTNAAETAGYQLLHVFEDDWHDRRDVVIMTIARKLHATLALASVLPGIDPVETSRIGARSCRLRHVTGHEAHLFMAAHHVQGPVASTAHFGLEDDQGRLRAVISLRSPSHAARMRRPEGTWEIVRYATSGIVQGGFSRLLAYAGRELKAQGVDLRRWVTFSDRCVSDGGLYEQCGFHVTATLPPDYRYVGDVTKWRREPKESFQRKRFRDDPNLVWDEAWTETQAAEANGLHRIWDAGKLRWEKDV